VPRIAGAKHNAPSARPAATGTRTARYESNDFETVRKETLMVDRRWQDGANLVLGAWFFVSPWVLGHAGSTAALNAHILGAAVVVVALIAAYMPKAWEEMINTLLGVWLVVSPFVLGFAATRIVALHTVVVGILATAFAVWAMASDKRLFERGHRRHSV
jgi:SPW repeat